MFFFFQAEDGIRVFCLSRGLGDCIRDREKTAYRKHLRASGYGEVTLLPGGACLMTQYHKIFSFFSGQKVISLSDTVPGIVWRRHQTHLTTEPLPSALLYRVVSVMFCVIAEKMWNIWSLGPCKAARNLQPGHISQKCGLLDLQFLWHGFEIQRCTYGMHFAILRQMLS